ncbi:NADH-quinone oxidoreductase subunit J [Euzebya sp.]|uniref:NADH-quinone oxidoreductase subunit J n=1 Tax=Euzebya sp. TaxID=1971409 RepID=UPI003513B6CB
MSAALLAQAADAAQTTSSGAAEFWLFWILAPLSLAAALAVVILKNPVHAALMLVVNFFTFAVFYAILEGQFLATIQVIVYAGAIMILFLFVLMLLGVDRETELGPGRLRGQKVAAILLGAGLFVALTGTIAGPYMGTDSACNRSEQVTAAVAEEGADAQPCAGLEEVNAAESGGNVQGIGRLLFTDYVWPFEVTSVLLVIAAIGAMVLGRRTDSLADLVDVGEAEPPGSTPELVHTTTPAPDGADDPTSTDEEAT